MRSENLAWLGAIWQSKPASIAELATIARRKPGNLSRTLKTMSHYGLVEMLAVNQRQLRPGFKATEFRILAGA